MKLKKIHLFFILLLTLFSSSLLGCINKEGYYNKEGYDNNEEYDNKEGYDNKEKFISSDKIPAGKEDLYILKLSLIHI